MSIQLSPTLEKRITRAAKAKGIKPEKLLAEAFKAYMILDRQAPPAQSDARRRLNELAKYRKKSAEPESELQSLLKKKKKTVDFMADVHKAKQSAGQLYEDNADFLERVKTRSAKHG